MQGRGVSPCQDTATGRDSHSWRWNYHRQCPCKTQPECVPDSLWGFHMLSRRVPRRLNAMDFRVCIASGQRHMSRFKCKDLIVGRTVLVVGRRCLHFQDPEFRHIFPSRAVAMESVLWSTKCTPQKGRGLVESDRARIQFTFLHMGRAVSPKEPFLILKVRHNRLVRRLLRGQGLPRQMCL